MLWQTLLFPHSSDPALSTTRSTAIRDFLKEQGYKIYDPFPGGLGAPIGKVTRLRMFLAPPQDDWQRLLIAPQDELSWEAAQQLTTALDVSALLFSIIDDEQFSIYAFDRDVVSDQLSAIVPYLKADSSLLDVQAAMQKEVDPSKADSGDLPPEIKQIADNKGVKMKHVDRLMGKMTNRLFKNADKDEAMDQGQSGLSGKQQMVNWNSMAGQRLIAIMRHLTVPKGYYRKPTWQRLTTAYQIARQQQRSGGEMLLPGDADVLQAVPNALSYQLLYFSKKLS